MTEEAFADDTPLVRLFDGEARIKLISVLVDERTRELNISELAHQAGIARSTVYDHIDDLVAFDVATITNPGAKANRYTLADNELTQRLYELDGLMLKHLLDADQAKPEP